MMNIKLIAFLFTTVLIFSGCYKDNFEFTPIPDREVMQPVGDISNFFAQIPNYFDSISFDASEDHLIFTENETVIQVLGSTFLDEAGDIVTGQIDFKYIEVLNHADYALYRLPTISDEQLLRSEGVYRFEARQGGKKLRMKEGKSIIVRLPVEKVEPGMQLFTGEGSGETFNWSPSKDFTGLDVTLETNEWFFDLDSGNQEFISGFGYLFNCDLFKWINVDIFADVPEDMKTVVCVELPEVYTNANTTIFMYFNDSNSILSLRGDADEKQWCEPYGATPIGYKVTFMVISDQGDDVFHFSLQEAVVKKDHLEFIEPVEKSFEEIIEAIKKL